jgi:hypothetical protein
MPGANPSNSPLDEPLRGRPMGQAVHNLTNNAISTSNPSPRLGRQAGEPLPGRRIVIEPDRQAQELEAVAPPYALPILPAPRPMRKFQWRYGFQQQFSTGRLLWAMKSKEIDHIKLLEYFACFGDDVIVQNLSLLVGGVPAIFYAVQTNDPEMARVWIEHGGDANSRNPNNNMPLLAFAVLNAIMIRKDTSAVVATLLSLGADGSSIPKHMYSPYLRDNTKPNNAAQSEEAWCNGVTGSMLESTLNLTQRYFLTKQTHIKPASIRLRDAARKLGLSPLFYLPYHIVGQQIAVKTLTDVLISHLVTDSNMSLVLLFVGSGLLLYCPLHC